ncbi:hypothetical protein OG588_27795 [Streptomyces prunicolor]|uniref:hypothetical protein n=1 Tax=Streptomyces prunicolor TaxID=67348 RepID=UPI0038698E15|nr:hypothetical protein OG588_27795 [Streptomyces prunicolor]
MSLLRRAAERRTVTQFGDSSIPTNGSLMTPTTSGVPVNEQAAMKLIAAHASVRIISSALAGRPLCSVQSRDGVLVPVKPAPPIVTDPFDGGAPHVPVPPASSRWPSVSCCAVSGPRRRGGEPNYGAWEKAITEWSPPSQGRTGIPRARGLGAVVGLPTRG